MKNQYLQYVREHLLVATADLSGESKVQLLAWLEFAQFYTKNFPRKKERIWDVETDSWI
ncbi:bacteriophage antitermination protein Q, partial [Salmonella enterica]|uniref:bacteriophage antitermination protein Q n=1 Tax=Salmonella enterica TaxID=28901 RepID=UPI0020C229D4